MRENGILRLATFAAVALLVTNSANASDQWAGPSSADAGVPAFVLPDDGLSVRRSVAPPGLLKKVRLDCDATGLGGGTCPSLQRCMNSCALVFDIEMVFCATVGMPWVGQCIINASDRWAQCRRDCGGDYG